MKLYFIIPTINGEINGEPFIFTDYEIVKYVKEEITVYEIDVKTLNVIEKED